MFLQAHDMVHALKETREQLKLATAECAKLSAENTKLKNKIKVVLCMYTVNMLAHQLFVNVHVLLTKR